MESRGRCRRQPQVPDWRYMAASAAVLSTLVVVGGGGAVARADTATGTPTRESVTTESSTSQTETVANKTEEADHSTVSRPVDETQATEPSAGDAPSVADGTVDSSPADSPTTDPTPPAQDDPPSTEVDSSPDSPTTTPDTPDTPTVPADDNPAIEPTPPAQDTGPDSSTSQNDSSSGPAPVVTEIATVAADLVAETAAAPAGTDIASAAEPSVDSTPVVTAPSVVESVAAAVTQPTLPAFEPNVVAPVVVTAVSTVVPLVSVTAVAPPGVLQWFVLLTWFQLQWLVQQSLSGPGATPGLGRLDPRNPMSTMFQNPSTTAFLATQLPWLRTTLDALQGMPMAALQGMRLVDLPIDPALLQRMSMTLAAETASAPAIAKSLANQVRSRLSAPCIGTFVRNVSVWALFTAAALGLLGLTSLTGIGTMLGFRQAKAGFALQASGLARFTGPGPLGVVREGGFVRIGSRRASAEPPRLRVVGADMRDSA